MLLLATNHVEAVVVDLLEVGVEQQVLQATILLVLAVLVTSILEAMQQQELDLVLEAAEVVEDLLVQVLMRQEIMVVLVVLAVVAVVALLLADQQVLVEMELFIYGTRE